MAKQVSDSAIHHLTTKLAATSVMLAVVEAANKDIRQLLTPLLHCAEYAGNGVRVVQMPEETYQRLAALVGMTPHEVA